MGVSHGLQLTNKSAAKPDAIISQKEVDKERNKLETMSAMLSKMLQSDTLSHSKVAPALKMFTSNLGSVLNATKGMKPAEAMQKLATAKASVSGLVSEMTNQQESLMREDFEQRESLLMGVLLSKKDKPMDEQLEILRNEDFEGLDVSKALLKAHDSKVALYKQAAQYLDSHKHAGGALSSATASHQSRLDAMAAAFDKRVTALENEKKVSQLKYKKTMAKLEGLAAKATGRSKMVFGSMIKKEQHAYKKASARADHDIESMKEAAAAFRKGDMKALNHARAALQKSLDSLKNKNGAMLVFLQQANTYLAKDCPYCAAQCVEKCHTGGKSFVACLTDCQDAGK
jgi:hypothetical protein